MKRLLPLFFLALVILFTGCKPQTANEHYTVVAPASLTPGDAIPAPTGDPILTVSGQIGVKNAGDTLVLDMATLEKFGLVEYAVNDPWLNAKNTYQGVLLSEFLKFVDASDTATTLKIIALDDYAVDITITDIEKWTVLLATQTNGAYMTIENNGPTRVIFPYDFYPEIDQLTYKDLWVWNIASMEIK